MSSATTNKTGGPVALAGFLYQIIVSLERVATIAISEVTQQKGEIQSARIILEPDSGGDLAIYRTTERIIEQFKSRRNGRPWSPVEIIDNVLRSLYSEISFDWQTEQVRYRFVTDGQCPPPSFRAFLDLFRNSSLPGDPIAALDDHDWSF